MKCKRKCTLLTLIMCICIVTLMFTGCGNGGQEQDGQNRVGGGNEVSGTILAVGSTALQPLAEQAARQFKTKYPNANVQVQGGGSGTGLTSVSQGAAQIGNSDIFAEEKEGIDASYLVDHKVAVVGFAVIVNSQVDIDNITQGQLIDIFTGKIDNWNKVGGKDLNIAIINRPAASGTRATFRKYALNGEEEAVGKALTGDSSGAILKTVADTPGAISYIGLSYIKNNTTVKALKLDGVKPTAENIIGGNYPIWSYEHMYTKGQPGGLTKAFIEYVASDEVKPLIQKLGYIPIGDMKAVREE